eukprot:1137719-Prymnesium_polylepis.2
MACLGGTSITSVLEDEKPLSGRWERLPQCRVRQAETRAAPTGTAESRYFFSMAITRSSEVDTGCDRWGAKPAAASSLAALP